LGRWGSRPGRKVFPGNLTDQGAGLENSEGVAKSCFRVSRTYFILFFFISKSSFILPLIFFLFFFFLGAGVGTGAGMWVLNARGVAGTGVVTGVVGTGVVTGVGTSVRPSTSFFFSLSFFSKRALY
jgi:hypothetical protein